MFKRLCNVLFAVSLTAAAFSQDDFTEKPFGSAVAKDVFMHYSNVLTNAKTIKAKFLMQWIGGGQQQGTVELTRPGIGMIKTPDSTWNFDGSQVEIHDLKANKTRSETQDPSHLAKIFKDNPEIAIWQPFFNPKGFLGAYEIDSDGFKQREDATLRTLVIYLDHPAQTGESTFRIYLDPQNDFVRQVEYKNVTVQKQKVLVVILRDIEITPVSSPAVPASP